MLLYGAIDVIPKHIMKMYRNINARKETFTLYTIYNHFIQLSDSHKTKKLKLISMEIES